MHDLSPNLLVFQDDTRLLGIVQHVRYELVAKKLVHLLQCFTTRLRVEEVVA